MIIENQLSQIISLLKEINAKLPDAPPSIAEESTKPKKRIPLHKDKDAIAEGVKELTLKMNAKIRANKEKLEATAKSKL